MTYLSGRLTTDPDQRSGAIDLADELGGEPAALAQAAAVIVSSGISCREYRDYFAAAAGAAAAAAASRRPRRGSPGRLSASYAEQLAPGAGTWPLLVLAALLDGHGIPCPCSPPRPPAGTWPAGRRAPAGPAAGLVGGAGPGAGRAGGRRRGGPPAVWVSPALQAAVRAVAPPELLDQAARAAADALARGVAGGSAAVVAGRAAAGVRGQPAAAAGDALWAGGGCHRVLLAAGQQPGRRRADRPGGRLVAGAGRRQRAAPRPGPPGHAGGRRPAGRRAAGGRAGGRRRAPGPGGCWPAAPSVLGPDHPGTIAAQVSLGRALAAAGEPGEARPRAGRGGRAQRAGPRPRRRRDPGRLGRVRRRVPGGRAGPPRRSAAASGRWPAASACTARTDPGTLAAALRLAAACLAAGKAKDAIGQYKRVLAAREHALGPDHPDTLAARARPGRRLRRRRADGRRAAASTSRPARATSARSAPITRTPWPAARTWPAPTAPRASSATRWPLLRDSHRPQRAGPVPRRPADPALRQALADITGEMTAG